MKKVNIETSIKSGAKGMSESTEILINYPNSYEKLFGSAPSYIRDLISDISGVFLLN